MIIDKALHDYIEKSTKEKFEWGKNDCALFTATWCEIKSGKNPAQGSYGVYDDADGAYKHLKEKYGTLRKAYDAHFERINPNFRQKGDVVLCKIDGSQTMGLCGGRGFVFFKLLHTGFCAKSNPDILCAWRVE